jgi:glycine C-acetyltransferase/8-amino-7-oxononanoate synthase
VPVIVGDPRLAVALCERALEDGVFAQAIRPPTVPPGSSRLRLAVMANHRADELTAAAAVIGRAARELGIATAEPARELRRAA